MPVKEEPPSPVPPPPPKEPKVPDFEFFVILLGDLSRLKLPSGFAEAMTETDQISSGYGSPAQARSFGLATSRLMRRVVCS